MAGKRIREDYKKVDQDKKYSLDEALDILESFSKSKFDETVEVVFLLGIDAKQTDQQVRGACSLPNGTGKTLRIAVFAKGEKAEEAQRAGADIVGADDLAETVLKGEINFDKIIATPDVMGIVGKLGKVLGPKGLMPNPKLGTVTQDIERAVREQKAGKVEFRVDKAANLHAPVGKRSFGKNKLKENIMSLIDAVVKAKPSASKGNYLKRMAISATHTPGIRVDVSFITKAL